jgi:hypothetical protein
MKILRWCWPLTVGIAFIGCGKTEVPVQSSGAGGPTHPTVAQENKTHASTPTDDKDSFLPNGANINTPAKELPVTVASAPDVVVKEFLNALKTGNDGVTAGLLTATARTETAKHNLAVQPPGTPTAQYQVTAAAIEPQDPTLAQVVCLWSETDEQGKPRTDEVIWVLKKEAEGWRVCGMATKVPTRAEPVLFNFENPPEMMQLSDEIGQEMEKLAQNSAAQNTPTGGPAALEAKAGSNQNKLRN